MVGVLVVGRLDLVEERLVAPEDVAGASSALRPAMSSSTASAIRCRPGTPGAPPTDRRAWPMAGWMTSLAVQLLVERRAAVAAEAALHLRELLNTAGAPRVHSSDRRLHREGRKEGRADRLLAHAAMADADLVGRFVDGIAHGAALAAAGQADIAHGSPPPPAASCGVVIGVLVADDPMLERLGPWLGAVPDASAGSAGRRRRAACRPGSPG